MQAMLTLVMLVLGLLTMILALMMLLMMYNASHRARTGTQAMTEMTKSRTVRAQSSVVGRVS